MSNIDQKFYLRSGLLNEVQGIDPRVEPIELRSQGRTVPWIEGIGQTQAAAVEANSGHIQPSLASKTRSDSVSRLLLWQQEGTRHPSTGVMAPSKPLYVPRNNTTLPSPDAKNRLRQASRFARPIKANENLDTLDRTSRRDFIKSSTRRPTWEIRGERINTRRRSKQAKSIFEEIFGIKKVKAQPGPDNPKTANTAARDYVKNTVLRAGYWGEHFG